VTFTCIFTLPDALVPKESPVSKLACYVILGLERNYIPASVDGSGKDISANPKKDNGCKYASPEDG
jgi:hypothetical protein